MRVEPVESLGDPRLAVYRNVRDPDLRARANLFLCEGRLGVRRLLAGGRFRPRSVFLTPAALAALSDALRALPEGVPVYRGSQALLNEVVGYHLHRGCLAAVERGEPLEPEAVLAKCGVGRPLLFLENVTDPDNVGAIFRNAASLGAGGVWLTSGCADPLYRKATRVSMGATLAVPFARTDAAPEAFARLAAAGRVVVALTPERDAERIESAAARLAGRPLALALGTEGEGLSPAARAAAAERVRIAMAPGVDSLNVGMAAGIALHRFAAGPGGCGAA